MLCKTKNSNWSLGKYAAVALIVGFSSLMVASCEREVMPTTANGEQMVKGNINVTGIINTPDHKPLMGATITDNQGKNGVTTDAAGRFSMKVPAGSDLKVSAPSLGAMDLKVNPKYRNANYDITMSSNGGKPTNMVFSPSADKQSVKVTVQTGEVNGETIFTVVEKIPEFPGGTQEMFMYLGRNIKYPTAAAKANVSGKVFVNFVVTSEGEIKDVTVLKGIGFGADEEAVRVVSTMPRWTPGMQSGRAVNVRYNLPIAFQIVQGGTSAVDKSGEKALSGVKIIETGENAPSGATVAYFADPKPLVVVDGVEQKTDYDLKKVDPNKIQAINVLKGQKATDKYGTKGANGVVEIIMKK